MKFFDELKRRNVIKSTIAYIVVAWVLLQVISIVLPNFEAPSWVFKSLTFVIAIGLPLWIIFSWVYEVTPDGLKKTAKVSKEQSITEVTNKRLNVIIIILLIIAIGFSFVNEPISKITSKNIVNSDLAFDNSIAVLPFDDMSEGNDTQWFCDGVTEDLLTNLSKIKGLRVISRTSINQYKNTDKTISEIAKELGVSYVVEGSVRKQQNNVLITAQLIKATDENLWADKYHEKLEDIFTIQNDVSRKIVRQLKIVISTEEEKSLNSTPTNNMESYQLFIKGRTIADVRTKESLETSIDFYKKAIALDPNYAEAYAEIANSIFLLYEYGGKPLSTAISESKTWIERALAINKNTVRAYSTLGFIAIHNKNWEKARIFFDKAISINPRDATSHHHYAIYLKEKPESDIKMGLAQISEAQQLDPFSKPITNNHIYALIANEKYTEAEELLTEKEFLFSGDEVLNFLILIKVEQNKDWTEAIIVLEEAVKNDPKNANLQRDLAVYYGSLNDVNHKIKHAKKAYELDAKTGISVYVYALLRNKDLTMVKKLLDNENLIKLMDKESLNITNALYYYEIGNSIKALEFANKLPNDLEYKFALKADMFVQMGYNKKAHDLLQNDITSNYLKATIFARLKEKDSMYHYLNTSTPTQSLYINSWEAFDPYRLDPKFKAYQNKNYIPISQQ